MRQGTAGNSMANQLRLIFRISLFATCNHPARWQLHNEPRPCNTLKNNEIWSFEGANYGGNFIATFLHTRSFNILRRTGTGVKRKTSENQRFSEEFIGLIDPSVTPERL